MGHPPQSVLSSLPVFGIVFNVFFGKHQFRMGHPFKTEVQDARIFLIDFTRKHGYSSFTCTPGPKQVCRLPRKINMFDANKMQDRVLVQARSRFSRYSYSKKKEKKMCPFRYHFGGTRLKKYASRVGATQIRKNGHKQIISFYRVEAS
mgnify:CR=1 FL=1